MTPKNIDTRPQTMATTGFNRCHIPQQDGTMHATSRRYGTETCQRTHPNNHSKYESNETTFRASFMHPKNFPSQVYRNRDTENSVSTEQDLPTFEHIQDKTNLDGPRQSLLDNQSGYVLNNKLWDSTSWRTEQNVWTDQQRTQYRKQFNQPKPFHNRLIKSNTGRLKRL